MTRKTPVLLWLSFVLALPAAAATKTWTGAVNNLWSVGGNWSGGVAPVDGDDLLFPTLFGPGSSVRNDLTGLDLRSLTFTSNSFYEVTGNGFTVTSGISAQSSLSIRVPVTLAASQTFSVAGGFDIHDTVNLNGYTLTLSGGEARLIGTLTGSGAVIQSSHMRLGGTSNFTGTYTMSGSLFVSGFMVGSTLTTSGPISGSGTLPTTIQTGNVMGPDSGNSCCPLGNLTTTGALTLNGGTLILDITNAQNDQIVVNGAVTLNNETLQVRLPFVPPNGGQTLTIIANDGTDPVSGTFNGLPEGAIFTAGSRSFQISYAGGTGNDVVLTVQSGGPKTWTAAVNNLWSVGGNWSDGVPPVDGDDLMFPPLFGAGGNMQNDLAGLDLGSLTFTSTEFYEISGNGFSLAGGINSQASVVLNVPVTLAASQTFSVAGIFGIHNAIHLNGHTLTLSGGETRIGGSLTGSGAVIQNSGVHLSGTSNFTGTYTLNGSLFVSGFMVGSTLTGSGPISGYGTLPTTIHSGVMGPDSGNSCCPLGNLTTTGALTLNGGTLILDITNAQNDQIAVNGAVTLNNPTLQVRLPFVPPNGGQTFTIIANDGTDPVSGTFNGLPEGAIFTVGPRSFRISYAGGTGNDVVLTVQSGGPKTWTAAVNNLWSVGGNWSDGVPPVDGDNPVFPPLFGAGGNMQNDLAGLDLGSLTFTSTEYYEINGNGFSLAGGINSQASIALNVPVTLAASQTFSVAGIFGIPNTIHLNGHTLTLSGGETRIGGSLTGSGAVIQNSPVHLSGTSNFTGTYTLNGPLFVSGSMTGSTLTGSGAISGYGTLPRTTRTGGVMSPDSGNSCCPLGVLTTSGALTFNGGTLAIDVTNEQNDQIAVHGALALNNATLQLRFPFAPPTAGQTLIIMTNDGTDPVTGTFNGLPEGSVFTAGSRSFRITYAGGTGNDVVLTVVTPTAVTLTPSHNPAAGAFTLTATVTSNAGTPTGTVRFLEGQTLLGTATLNSSGIATLTITLPPGSHTIVAEYVGQGAFAPSVSPPLAQVVGAEVPAVGTIGLLLCALALAAVGLSRMVT